MLFRNFKSFHFRKFFKGTQFRDPIQAWGKIAIVTGSSSGIGMCIAEELNRRGVKVYMLVRDRVKTEKVVSEMVKVFYIHLKKTPFRRVVMRIV